MRVSTIPFSHQRGAVPQEVQSSATCNLSWGGKCSIASTIMWFVAACLMCCVGKRVAVLRSEEADAKGKDNEESPGEDETPAVDQKQRDVGRIGVNE